MIGTATVPVVEGDDDEGGCGGTKDCNWWTEKGGGKLGVSRGEAESSITMTSCGTPFL